MSLQDADGRLAVVSPFPSVMQQGKEEVFIQVEQDRAMLQHPSIPANLRAAHQFAAASRQLVP